MSSSPTYPSIYYAADEAAARRQRDYIGWSRVQLVALAGIALTSGLADPASDRSSGEVWRLLTHGFAILTAVLTAFVLFLGLRLRIERVDDKWFHCRALAENVKSFAWKYAMGSSKGPNAERLFFESIYGLQARLVFSRQCISEKGTAGDWITPWMKALRAASAGERVSALRDHRIADQRRWYNDKAASNARAESRWSYALIVLELAALVFSISQVALRWNHGGDNYIDYGLMGLLATIAAGALAWTQLKRFSDLAQTYRIAADDLAQLDVDAESLAQELKRPDPPADVDERLRGLVQRTENAISREHSLWVGQHFD